MRCLFYGILEFNYISDSSLEDLRINIVSNLHKYKSDEVRVDQYFLRKKWSFSSKIRIENIDLHMPQSSTIHFDFENTKNIYFLKRSFDCTSYRRDCGFI